MVISVASASETARYGWFDHGAGPNPAPGPAPVDAAKAADPDNRKRIATAAVLHEEFEAIHGQGGYDLNTPKDGVERLRDYYDRVHSLKKDSPAGQAAICLSGGGIRSAAFALGVLQGLARHRLLSQVHYLSTVSGGGYVGAWLTAWVSRLAESSMAPGAAALNTAAPPDSAFERVERDLNLHAEDEPPSLRYLRRYQAFLTPKTGFASADTWSAIATVFRNLLLNWLVFVPMILAVLLLPRLVSTFMALYTWSFTQAARSFLAGLRVSADGVPFAQTTWFPEIMGTALVVIGLTYFMHKRPSVGASDMTNRQFQKCSLLPITGGAVLLVCAEAAWARGGHEAGPDSLGHWSFFSAFAFLLAAILSLVMDLIAYVRSVRGQRLLKRTGRRAQSRRWIAREAVIWVRRRPGVLLEPAALLISGAAVGFFVWCGVRLRSELVGGPSDDLRAFAAFGVPWLFLCFILGLAVFTALTSRVFRVLLLRRRPEMARIDWANRAERDREWLARTAGYCGIVAVTWTIVFSLVLYGWDAENHVWHAGLAAVGVGTGGLSIVGGASPLSKVAVKSVNASVLPLTRIISLASLIFIGVATVMLAHAGAAVLGWMSDFSFEQNYAPLGDINLFSQDIHLALDSIKLQWLLTAIIALAAVSVVASVFVNVNYFSLNALYRFRLVRTFLGASNMTDFTSGVPAPRNSFDNFSDTDNLAMAALWAKQAAGPSSRRSRGPFLVVNMALNLVGGKNLAWQERKAAPFISTPLRTGGHEVGYCRSAEYAGGISLGTVMSISGAAASPNWGYHSSPLTSMLMALFNVRLGAWLGNPASSKTRAQDRPSSPLTLLWQEALGRTNAEDENIYLSDGGHFDNLGLYEMIRRRCHTIIVSDAGCDANLTLEDLGNAVRKISIDLGVSITFERIDFHKRGADPANPGVYCAIGRIRYPEVNKDAELGSIVYLKPGFYADAPADVRAFAAANAKFPHDTTLNQWFTESQFESYRALGSHVIRMITGERDEAGNVTREAGELRLPEFVRQVAGYLSGYASRAKTGLRFAA